MRAPSTKKKVKSETDAPAIEPVTGIEGAAITRISPLRVSTFVSIAPVYITNDFGVMARQEGDPAPYEHQFYSATFQGLLSLDLANAGMFYHSRRTGFQNLDSIRVKQAQDSGLEHIEGKLAYRLPIDERVKRLKRLIEAIPLVQGGAKQTLHYTDVTPVVTIAAVTQYGNHPFNFLFDEREGQVVFNAEAFERTLKSVGEQILSPVYIGWKPGYEPDQEKKLTDIALPANIKYGVELGTPLEVFRTLADHLEQNPGWLD